jgi:hypothetical protein
MRRGLEAAASSQAVGMLIFGGLAWLLTIVTLLVPLPALIYLIVVIHILSRAELLSLQLFLSEVAVNLEEAWLNEAIWGYISPRYYFISIKHVLRGEVDLGEYLNAWKYTFIHLLGVVSLISCVGWGLWPGLVLIGLGVFPLGQFVLAGFNLYRAQRALASRL